MLIRIFCSFLNRSTNIIKFVCSNGSSGDFIKVLHTLDQKYRIQTATAFSLFCKNNFFWFRWDFLSIINFFRNPTLISCLFLFLFLFYLLFSSFLQLLLFVFRLFCRGFGGILFNFVAFFLGGGVVYFRGFGAHAFFFFFSYFF